MQSSKPSLWNSEIFQTWFADVNEDKNTMTLWFCCPAKLSCNVNKPKEDLCWLTEWNMSIIWPQVMMTKQRGEQCPSLGAGSSDVHSFFLLLLFLFEQIQLCCPNLEDRSGVSCAAFTTYNHCAPVALKCMSRKPTHLRGSEKCKYVLIKHMDICTERHTKQKVSFLVSIQPSFHTQHPRCKKHNMGVLVFGDSC